MNTHQLVVDNIDLQVFENKNELLFPFSEIKKLSSKNTPADHNRLQRQLKKNQAEKHTFDRLVYYSCKSLLALTDTKYAAYLTYTTYLENRLKSLQTIEQSVIDKDNEIDRLKAKKNDSTLKSSQKSQQIEVLNNRLEAKKQLTTELQKQLDNANQALKKAAVEKNKNVSQLKQLKTTYTSSNSSYTDLQATYKELETSYTDLQASYKKSESECNGLLQVKSELEANYIDLHNTYGKLQHKHSTLQATYNELETELKPHINSMKHQKKLIRTLLYSVLCIAAIATGLVFYEEFNRLDGQNTAIVVLMAVLFGSMMGITTFFTGHMTIGQRQSLLTFFCIVEFCSMNMYLKTYNTDIPSMQWILKFIITFFLPVTNLILANIIEHIRTGKSNY